MKAVIFAAGKSTRTYPLTLTRPKPLLPVMGRPILAWQLDAMPREVDTVVLVVGYKHEMIRAHFGASYGRLKLEYVAQTEQLGTGHAVLVCEGAIDGPFLAMNGDDLYAPEDLAAVAAGFVLRAVGGGAAVNARISTWFLIVAAAGSLFIVTGKRSAEVTLLGDDSGRAHV